MSTLREAIEASMNDALAVIVAAVKHDNPLGCQGCARLSDLALQAHLRAEAAEARAARLREQLEEDDLLRAHCEEEIEKLRGALIRMVRQFAHWSDDAGGYMTGGLSALQDAFEALRWSDPRPEPEDRCEEPGCMRQRSCGMPTPDGYRWLCGEHYRLVEEATR